MRYINTSLALISYVHSSIKRIDLITDYFTCWFVFGKPLESGVVKVKSGFSFGVALPIFKSILYDVTC